MRVRFRIEVVYEADQGEDVGAAARVLASELAAYDGVVTSTAVEDAPGRVMLDAVE